MKQLNQRRNNTQRPQPSANRMRNNNNRYQDQITNIPTTMAYTINNKSTANKHVLRGKEYIGVVSIGPTTPTGYSFVFELDPTMYATTRFGRLASSFEKFRFKQASVMLASNFSTTVSGSIIAGYMENPDQSILPAPAIFNQVFTSGSGVSQSLWKPLNVRANFTDKGKWYNIDADSEESMQTQQGKFIFVVQSPVGVTGEVQIPVLLDYDIEFSGSATQPLNTNIGPAVLLNGSVYTKRSTEGAGEYHANTPTTLVEDQIYMFTPVVPIIPTAQGNAYALYMVYNAGTLRSHSFYASLGDALKLENKILATNNTFTLASNTIIPLNN